MDAQAPHHTKAPCKHAHRGMISRLRQHAWCCVRVTLPAAARGLFQIAAWLHARAEEASDRFPAGRPMLMQVEAGVEVC
jgi:hypothetical protein